MENWTCVSEREVTCSSTDFHSGVEVWLRRPNVVNKRVLGAVILEDKPLKHFSTDVDSQWIEILARLGCDENLMLSTDSKIIIREILPKPRSIPPGREAVLIDKQNHCVMFIPMSSQPATDDGSSCGSAQILPYNDSGGYMLRYWEEESGTQKITLHIRMSDAGKAMPTNGVTVPTSEWLATILLPKITQWSAENALKVQSASSKHVNRPPIPLDRYCQLYSQLKEKYGPTLVHNWPEATDPHKFVYEDIAIATYLLVLWEAERKELGLMEKQSFIDLGCGNGLLVYLLSSEGHPGKGIDLRERKIWRMFGKKANLEVCTLTPSDSTLFPGFDWLLGNHSDELTPWIPVMAAHTSYHTRYFVLPCCPHDFDRKFSRVNTHKSQYRSYLDYVSHIGEVMGFKVEEDTMRIPSSKRVCQIGRSRMYPPEDEPQLDQQRKAFLLERCHQKPPELTISTDDGSCVEHMAGVEICKGKSNYVGDCNDIKSEHDSKTSSPSNEEPVKISGNDGATGEEKLWSVAFKPRDTKEHVRNCSLVNHDIKQHIVNTITTHLLKTEHYITVQHHCHVGHSSMSSASVPGNDESIVIHLFRRHEDINNVMSDSNKQRPTICHCCCESMYDHQQLPCWEREAGKTVENCATLRGCPCKLSDGATIEWNTGGNDV